MLSIRMHALSQSLSPLVDGHVTNVLLQTVPDFNEALLQLIDIVHMTFIHSLLRNTPDLIIHSIQVWAVWGQTAGPKKSGISCCSSLMVSLAR